MGKMDQDKNVGFVFKAISEECADFPAIISENGVLTYEQLWLIVESFALKMREHGVNQTSLIALNTTDMVVSLAAMLASSLLGAQFVIASKLLADSKVLAPSHFFKSQEVTGSKEVNFIEIDESWEIRNRSSYGKNQVPFDGYSSPDSPWLNLHTSGSTGTPKFITLSQRIVFDRTHAIQNDFPFGKTCIATTYAYTSRPFFARALGALFNAGAIVNSFNVAFWQSSGVNLVFGSPSQTARLFSALSVHPKISTVEVSGAKLSDQDARTLLKNFETLVDVYGASETNKTFTNFITIGADDQIISTGQQLDSKVEINSDDGQLCKAGQIGTIRIQNSYMVNGYLNNKKSSKECFRNGWFYPGDFGCWGQNGELQILGRNDDVINLGGLKINGLLVDEVIKTVFGISDAICFKNPKMGVKDELVAYAVFDGKAPKQNCIADAKSVCQEKLGIYLVPHRILEIDAIPSGENRGAIRTACQKLLLDRIGQANEKED